jgi:hypothetical protein
MPSPIRREPRAERLAAWLGARAIVGSGPRSASVVTRRLDQRSDRGIFARAMNRTAVVSLLVAACALSPMIAGCGGGTRAALTATVFPGDRAVNGRRLASLASQYENTFGCTEADTIVISGLAPSIYHVDGCAHTLDFQLSCHMGGYGGTQNICDWIAFEDLTVRAGVDFNGCDPAAVDLQVVGPTTRLATGCGYRATYTVQCGGASCTWVLSSRIEADSGGAGGGADTY